MFKNYILIGLRLLRKHKSYSIINIVGLAIGMTSFILIMLWVANELNFDRFHQQSKNIFRIVSELTLGGTTRKTVVTSPPMGLAMKNEFPEVKQTVRFFPKDKTAIKYDEKQLYEENIFYAEGTIFEVFSFELLSGDPKAALNHPYSIIFTEEMSKKYFGNEDPIGKTVIIDGKDDFKVTGVIEDIPQNSHIQFDFLLSYETLYAENSQQMVIWGIFGHYTYILTDDNVDVKALEEKTNDLVDANLGEALSRAGGVLRLFLQPLDKIYLHSNLEGEIGEVGDINYVYLFVGIAVFIILIACFNFINISTARSAIRSREVGVRKTLGAKRHILILQFLGESILYSFIAALLTVILVELFLPYFSVISNREISIHLIGYNFYLVILTGLALMVGILAGFYPAFFLSGFIPVKVLKGNITQQYSHSGIRKTLVILQFAVSITLIISSLTIYKQMEFIRNKKLGFASEQLVVLPNAIQTVDKPLSTIKQTLMEIPGVIDVSGSDISPGKGGRISNVHPEGTPENDHQMSRIIEVDYDFTTTMGMDIFEGRNFRKELITDQINSILINETAVNKFGFDDPIGKEVSLMIRDSSGASNPFAFKVIGVVRDFHMGSLHEVIEPAIMIYNLNKLTDAIVRVSPADIMNTMDRIGAAWKELDARGRPFDYYFMEDTFNNLYNSEKRLQNIALYFTILAIFIGSLGLFGLSSYKIEQRTKEIGIRRVLGASIPGILKLLSRDYLALMLAANVLSWPAAYFLMNKWLQNFAYKTNIGWSILLLTAFTTIMIVVISTSFQSIRAALANPVKALKYE